MARMCCNLLFGIICIFTDLRTLLAIDLATLVLCRPVFCILGLRPISLKFLAIINLTTKLLHKTMAFVQIFHGKARLNIRKAKLNFMICSKQIGFSN